jgi:hypothetical protein
VVALHVHPKPDCWICELAGKANNKITPLEFTQSIPYCVQFTSSKSSESANSQNPHFTAGKKNHERGHHLNVRRCICISPYHHRLHLPTPTSPRTCLKILVGPPNTSCMKHWLPRRKRILTRVRSSIHALTMEYITLASMRFCYCGQW